MTGDSERLDLAPSANSRWSTILSWTSVFAVAILLTELTTHPTIGAVSACLKFGWGDFRNFFWLRRSDPYITRGKVCSWFFVALGFWKIAFTSLPIMALTGFIQGIIANLRRPAAGAIEDTIIAVLLTSAVSFTLSGLVTSLAFFLAWQSRVKVWIDNSVTSARRRETWPPLGGTANLAGALLVSATVPAAFLLILPATAVLATYLAIVVGQQFAGRPPQLLVITTIVAPITLGMLIAAWSIAKIRKTVGERVMATTSHECWLASAPPEPQWVSFLQEPEREM